MECKNKVIFSVVGCSLLLFISLITNVYATEVTNITNEHELKNCLLEPGTCKLTKDFEITDISTSNGGTTTELRVKDNVILDLNGHKITAVVNGITQGIIKVHYPFTLTINDTVGGGEITTGETNVYAGLQVGIGNSSEGVARLIVNGGKIYGNSYGIVGNGTKHNTEITINGGTIISNGTGIYHPQDGKLTINGGTITGKNTGIEIRSGELIVNNGTIEGLTNSLTCQKNNSGTTTTGAGIAVVQHTTQLPIKVQINGGTIKGYVPFYENNIQENPIAAIEKITLAIDGGNFETTGTGTNSIEVADETNFIKKGTFNKKIAAIYITENNKIQYNITLADGTNSFVNVAETTAHPGDEIALIIIPNKNYILHDIEITNTTFNETNSSFTMPAEPVVITAIVQKIASGDLPIVNPEAEFTNPEMGIKINEETNQILINTIKNKVTENENFLANSQNNDLVITIDIQPLEITPINEKTIKEKINIKDFQFAAHFNINVNIRMQNNIIATLNELTKQIELLITIPEELRKVPTGFKRTYYVIRTHINPDQSITYEKIPTELASNGKSVIFKTNKFSSFSLGYQDTIIPTPKTGNPQTFDYIASYWLINIVSVIILINSTIYLNKKYN